MVGKNFSGKQMSEAFINSAFLALSGGFQDGLVHISQMSEKFIKHPLEAVSVGDVVEVRVLGVDEKKNRISLSMKGLNK